MGNKRFRRLLLTKTFPDGHKEEEVVVLNRKGDTDLNPWFESDGEYYYWDESVIAHGAVQVYKPSRVPYKGMTAELLPYRMSSWPQYLRSEDGLRSIGVVPQKPEYTGRGADPKRAVGGQEIGNTTPLPDNAKKEGYNVR